VLQINDYQELEMVREFIDEILDKEERSELDTYKLDRYVESINQYENQIKLNNYGIKNEKQSGSGTEEPRRLSR
jgi:hypothetical protein